MVEQPNKINIKQVLLYLKKIKGTKTYFQQCAQSVFTHRALEHKTLMKCSYLGQHL